jgi:diguanylate cyclase (GGDEF)-like protein/PAS domain S-box-containing protein
MGMVGRREFQGKQKRPLAHAEKPMSSEGEVDYKFLAENSGDIICRAGMDQVLRYVSPSSLHLLGWTPEEMTGRPVYDFILAEDIPLLAATIARNLSLGEMRGSETIRMLRKDGTTVWIESTGRAVRDPVTGEPKEFVVVMRDIAERKLLEERLSQLALTDGLTGLANRRAFDEDLEREWKRTLRDGGQISLLLLDIDRFKEFNDLYGHQVGDDCLRAIAAAVTRAVRATDIVARYGGEEVAIILPATDSPGAVGAAEKIRAALEALRITHEGNPEGGGWGTASIGVATGLARLGGTMAMPQSLIHAADNALYRAKREGRNRLSTALLVAPHTPAGE